MTKHMKKLILKKKAHHPNKLQNQNQKNNNIKPYKNQESKQWSWDKLTTSRGEFSNLIKVASKVVILKEIIKNKKLWARSRQNGSRNTEEEKESQRKCVTKNYN